MKEFFDKDSDLDLPEDLQWQNMEEGILNKMSAIEKTEGRKKGSLQRYGLLLLLLISLTTGGVFTYYYWSPQNALENYNKTPINLNQKPNNAVKNTDDINAVEKEKARDSQGQHQVGSPSKNETPLLKGPRQPVQSLTEIKNSALKNTQANAPVSLPKAEESTANNLDKTNQNPAAAIAEAPSEVGHNFTSQTGGNSSDQLNLPTKAGADAFTIAPSKHQDSLDVPNSVLASAHNDSTHDEKTAEKVEIGKQEKQKAPYFQKQYILEGGITFWNDGSGQSMPDRSDYEQPLPSFQLQGQYVYGIKRGFFLMTGFQYQQLESKFEYSGLIPDYVLTLEDTVVQVRNNLATGRQVNIYGDVEQTVEAERRVVHYNTTRLLKLSLGAGKSWRFQSLQADLYLGGTINALANNRGKTLVQGEVLRYNGGASANIENNLLLEAFVGGRIHYFLDPRVALTASFQVQKSLMNWSTLESAQFYPISGGLQLGISYSLPKP